MAVTIAYAPPLIQLPGSIGSAPVFGSTVASHVNQFDICQLVTGSLVPAAVGATANIAGIASHDSNSVFQQNDTDVQGVFGVTQISAASGLMPNSPAFTLVETLGNPIIVEMSLNQAYPWLNGTNIGTAVGINIANTISGALAQTGGITPATGMNVYIADPAQAACGVIVGQVNKPYNSGTTVQTNQAAYGTLGVRILVAFNLSALAVIQGY